MIPIPAPAFVIDRPDRRCIEVQIIPSQARDDLTYLAGMEAIGLRSQEVKTVKEIDDP